MERRRRMGRLGLVFVAALAAACGDDGTGPQTPEDVEFAPALGVDLAAMTRLPSGVYVRTLTEGQGAAVTEQDVIDIRYRLWLPDGSLLAEGPLTEAVGGFIPGFGLGVVGMRVGEVRLIVIPSALAYGEQGSGATIPPNAVLVFEVTLDGIHSGA